MESLIFEPKMFAYKFDLKPTNFYIDTYLPFINSIKNKMNNPYNFELWFNKPKYSLEKSLKLFDKSGIAKEFGYYRPVDRDTFIEIYNSAMEELKLKDEIQLFIDKYRDVPLVEINVIPENNLKPFRKVKDLLYERKLNYKESFVEKYCFCYDIIDFENPHLQNMNFLSNFSKNTLNKLKENYTFDITNDLDLSSLKHGDIVKFNLTSCKVFYSSTNSFENLKVYNSNKGLYITPKPSKKRVYLPLDKFDLYSDYKPTNIDKAKLFQDNGLINKNIQLNDYKKVLIKNITKLLEKESEYDLEIILSDLKTEV